MLSPGKVCASKIDLDLTANLNPCNNIDSCVIPELTLSSPHFKVQVELKGRNCCASVAAMVDCGATALFISERFVKTNRVRTHPLVHKIPLHNIDGSRNKAGDIGRFVRLQLQVGGVEEWREFLVTELGLEDLVLGLPWLRSVNLAIDWVEGTMEVGLKTTNLQEETDLGERVQWVAANRQQRRRWWKAKVLEDPTERLWCTASYTYSTELAEKAGEDK
jgi:gag-polyprotein putative aspartyl protease